VKRLVVSSAAVLAAAAIGVTPAPAAATVPTATAHASVLEGSALLDVLRQGGLVIMFRHGATDRSQPDDDVVDFDDCATQRVLTDEGRADAVAIGEAFRDLTIPVGAVWASPYCRSRDTGELAFGRAEVIPGLERFFPERDAATDERVSALIAERAPGAGQPSLVIAGHGEYPSILSPAVTLEEGEAAVYSVQGDGAVLLGRVLPDGWMALDPGFGTAAAVPLTGLAAVVDEVRDSVVVVEVDGEPSGTGFRVALPGIVVTTATVVGDADEVDLVLRDGSRRSARVVGRSAALDVAAVEVDDSALPPLHSNTGLADAQAEDPVLAVVAAPALPEASRWSTFVAGDVSVTGPDGAPLAVVTFGADLPPIDVQGAGAPLIDTSGDVLGVVSTAIELEGGPASETSAAIPVALARSEVIRLIDESATATTNAN